MSVCSVAVCKNHSKKTSGVIYHCFPKDPSICATWVVKCRREGPVNAAIARICSDHFIPTDYEDDLKNRILGLPQKKILKKDAVPSIKLSPKVSTDEQYKELRNERHIKREVRNAAMEHIHILSPKKPRLEVNFEATLGSINNFGVGNSSSDCNENGSGCKECIDKLNKILNLERELRTLKSELQSAKKKNKVNAKKLQRHLRSKVTLKTCLNRHRKDSVKINQCNKLCHSFYENAKKLLTPNQIKAISSNKKTKQWNSDDISRAIILRALNQKSYEFLRQKMHFPLPSPATLKRWCAKFQCNPGMLTNVLELISKSAETMSELERTCVLSFDEMHIDSKISYHSGLDQALGPFSRVQVVLARGLMSPWKQPVYYAFDTTMTKDVLFDVIKQLEHCKIRVAAIVSDLGGCNTLYKDLCIKGDKHFFVNPSCDDRNVYVFADMPHYFKLLRNHFLDSGLVLKDGTVLKSDVLVDLLNKDSGEIRLCHKLKPDFLTVTGNARQKVGPAKAIFSNTVAKAILVLLNNKMAADFFELMDKFFDVMNSRCPYVSKSNNCAFGVDDKVLKEQQNTLSEVHNAISSLRVVGKKNMLPFQKGMLMSIASLTKMFEDLRKMGLKYIMTARLTQDALENLFGQVRGVGRFNDHPTPTEVTYRLRQLLLSNKLPKPSPKSNTVDESEEMTMNTYLTAELLDSVFNQQENDKIPGDTEPNQPISIEIPTTSSTPVNDEEECALAEIPEKEWAEEEAINYIAGYVAYKVRNIDPSLGTMTKCVEEKTSWICSISRGGLTEPSDNWKSQIKLFEKEFNNLHGDLLDRRRNVVSRYENRLIELFPSVCPKAIRLYSKLRTIIRIRHLNRLMKADNRKSDQKMIKWLKSAK